MICGTVLDTLSHSPYSVFSMATTQHLITPKNCFRCRISAMRTCARRTDHDVARRIGTWIDCCKSYVSFGEIRKSQKTGPVMGADNRIFYPPRSGFRSARMWPLSARIEYRKRFRKVFSTVRRIWPSRSLAQRSGKRSAEENPRMARCRLPSRMDRRSPNKIRDHLQKHSRHHRAENH